MFSLDEEKIDFVLGIRAFFLAKQESRECFGFISDVSIRGIHLSLALCTAKFKQPD